MLFLSMLVLGLLIGFVGAGGAGLTITLLTVGFDVPIHTALAVARHLHDDHPSNLGGRRSWLSAEWSPGFLYFSPDTAGADGWRMVRRKGDASGTALGAEGIHRGDAACRRPHHDGLQPLNYLCRML